jgi:formylglycine-generating enzyme required for sulfatase activity
MKIQLLIFFTFLQVGIKVSAQLPTGMMKISNNLFVDQKEVTVGNWLKYYYYSYSLDTLKSNQTLLPQFDSLSKKKYEYLFYLENKEYELSSPPQYIGHVYDSNEPQLPFPKDSLRDKKQAKKYFEGLSILELPITNISYEQAVGYCEWLTKINSDYRRSIGLTEINYSLPTIEQFISYKDTASTLHFLRKNKYLTPIANCSDANPNFDGRIGKEPVEVTSFYSSMPFALFGTIGNVSEMTNDKGKAIGGSYFHKFEESSTNSIQYYNAASPWLGFRCIAKYQKL